MFNVSHLHSIAFTAGDSNTHRPRHSTFCMCLSSVPKRARRDIQMLQAFKGVIGSYDALVDLLESIEQFLNRLEIYTKIEPTDAMTEMVV